MHITPKEPVVLPTGRDVVSVWELPDPYADWSANFYPGAGGSPSILCLADGDGWNLAILFFEGREEGDDLLTLSSEDEPECWFAVDSIDPATLLEVALTALCGAAPTLPSDAAQHLNPDPAHAGAGGIVHGEKSPTGVPAETEAAIRNDLRIPAEVSDIEAYLRTQIATRLGCFEPKAATWTSIAAQYPQELLELMRRYAYSPASIAMVVARMPELGWDPMLPVYRRIRELREAQQGQGETSSEPTAES